MRIKLEFLGFLVAFLFLLLGSCGRRASLSDRCGHRAVEGTSGSDGSAGTDSGGSGGEGQAGAGGTSGSSGAGGEGAEGGNSGSGAAAGEGGSGGESGSGGPAGDGGSGATSDGAGGAGGELTFTEHPTLVMSVDSKTPLYGRLRFATNRRTSARVITSVGDRAWERHLKAHEQFHRHTLLRFIPGMRHRIELQVEDEDGAVLVSDEAFEVTPPSLPADFPKLDVRASVPREREPGILLMCIPTVEPALGGYVVIVDEEGEVVWWHYDAEQAPGDLRRLRSGNLFWVSRSRRELREVDMTGQTVRVFQARGPVSAGSDAGFGPKVARPSSPPEIEVPTDSFHHEASELDSGNILTLSSEVRALAGYPTSERDATPRPKPLNVVGDAVVEFSPTGSVVRRWSLFDILDPYRVGWDSFGNGWRAFYDDPTNIDFSHTNSVIVHPQDGDFIVSVRNLDTVVKFSQKSELKWILANPASWAERFRPYLLTPTGSDFEWQYHQHAPELTSRGTLLVFDNGVRRAPPPGEGLTKEERYSRIVEFQIDEAARVVSTVWQYGDKPPSADRFYAMTMGDVDELPETGNVLFVANALLSAPDEPPNVIIREVTRATPPSVVFDLRIVGAEPDGQVKHNVYRVEHLPDIYPE